MAAAADSSNCPICFNPLRRAFVLPCGHAFSDRCAARFLWDKPSCPVCRAAVTSAKPAWDLRGASPPASYAARILTVKHRGVEFQVDLDINAHECPYERLSTMFAIPQDRLKIIQKGKLVPAKGSPDLEEALRPGVPMQLVGSRQEHQLPPDPSTLRCAEQGPCGASSSSSLSVDSLFCHCLQARDLQAARAAARPRKLAVPYRNDPERYRHGALRRHLARCADRLAPAVSNICGPRPLFFLERALDAKQPSGALALTRYAHFLRWPLRPKLSDAASPPRPCGMSDPTTARVTSQIGRAHV